MVLEGGQGCSEVLTFHMAPTGHLLAKRSYITCWPQLLPHWRVQSVPVWALPLKKKIRSFHLPRAPPEVSWWPEPLPGLAQLSRDDQGPVCTQSPSPAPGAPTPRAQPSREGNELQAPSCAGRWKAWRQNVLRFTKTSGLSHLLNQPQENTPRLSFLVEGTKV